MLMCRFHVKSQPVALCYHNVSYLALSGICSKFDQMIKIWHDLGPKTPLSCLRQKLCTSNWTSMYRNAIHLSWCGHTYSAITGYNARVLDCSDLIAIVARYQGNNSFLPFFIPLNVHSYNACTLPSSSNSLPSNQELSLVLCPIEMLHVHTCIWSQCRGVGRRYQGHSVLVLVDFSVGCCWCWCYMVPPKHYSIKKQHNDWHNTHIVRGLSSQQNAWH